MRRVSALSRRCVLLGSLALVVAGSVGAEPWQIIFAGDQALEQGLQAIAAPGVGHRVVRATEPTCWATNRRAGQYKIAVQAANEISGPRPMPVQVTVTYLDRGHGQFALEYDAVDFTGQLQRVHGPVVTKQDTNQWKEASFQLPDAALFSPPIGWWLAVDSFGEMVAEDDEYVRQITVRPGGLSLITPSLVLAANQEFLLQVMARGPQGELLPGPEALALQASGGSLPAQATLTHGLAEFYYQTPATPGEVVLAARCGDLHTARRLLVWPGRGRVSIESILVGAALGLDAWMYWPMAARCQAGTVAEEAEPGGAAAVLNYRFTGAYWPGYVDLNKRTHLRGLPLELNLEVQGEGGGSRLQAILEDSSGQRFCYSLGELRWPIWTPLRANLQGPARFWGGAADGQFHYPLYFRGLRVVQGPIGSAQTGQLGLRNVFVRTLAPGPEAESSP